MTFLWQGQLCCSILWNPRLSELLKEYRKAKRLFANRSDEANEKKLKEILRLFKEEEINARNQYLDDLMKLLDLRKPTQSGK